MPKSYTVVVVFQTLFSIVVGVLRESGNPSRSQAHTIVSILISTDI